MATTSSASPRGPKSTATTLVSTGIKRSKPAACWLATASSFRSKSRPFARIEGLFRMADKPVLLVVDDNPDVLATIAEDLRARYGEQHDVRSARSGSDALALLRAAQEQGSSVALVLSDQRMPRQLGQ